MANYLIEGTYIVSPRWQPCVTLFTGLACLLANAWGSSLRKEQHFTFGWRELTQPNVISLIGILQEGSSNPSSVPQRGFTPSVFIMLVTSVTMPHPSKYSYIIIFKK